MPSRSVMRGSSVLLAVALAFATGHSSAHADVIAATQWTAVADAYVNSVKPTWKYGSSRFLRADGSPDVRTYLRFVVTGAPSGPHQTVLRIRHDWADPSPPFCDEPTDCLHVTRVHVRSVLGAWDEATLTYENAPAVGDVLGVSSDVVRRKDFWAEIDLGTLVDGDGVYELAMTGSTSTNQTFASREGRLLSAPKLVILPSG